MVVSVAREMQRNPEAVFEKLSVRHRILVRLLTDMETYAVELASKVGVSRTAIIKAVDQLEEKGLVMTRMEAELPEQLKRPQQRRIALTDTGKARAEEIRSELENQPSPFDELWTAIRMSRMPADGMNVAPTRTIRLR